MAVFAFQKGASIKAQMRLTSDQRVIGKACVLCGVGHDEQPGLQDGVGTDRDVERGLAHAQSDLGLEPLTVAVDEVDHRNRRFADIGRDVR